MAYCKDCDKTFDEGDYKVCPYCGQVSGEEIESEKGATRELEAEPKEEAFIETGAEKKKPAGGMVKYFLIGAAALVVVAVAISAIFALDDSHVTVPDKYDTIQEAIDAAEDGDEIVVDTGVYRENIDFKGKNITLRSVDPDDPEVVERTIIDGSGSGTVVSFRSGEGEEAVLSGFTVTRGSGILISGGGTPLIEKCIIEDNDAEYGAGIVIFDSAPTIRENIIIGNSGFLGGGLFIEESSPQIEGNRIVSNRAEMGSGVVVISNSSPVLVNNTISNNVAARLGGGIVIAVNSTPTIRGNTITGNSAERNGGGILIEESEPIIEDNKISGNRAANGGGLFIVNTMSTALLITGNEIVNNLAYIAGGGLYMEGSSPTIEDNSFTGNLSEYLGGGAAVYNSEPIVLRNLFEDNQAKESDGGGALWVSADSVLELNDPDDNTYSLNEPNDIYTE